MIYDHDLHTFSADSRSIQSNEKFGSAIATSCHMHVRDSNFTKSEVLGNTKIAFFSILYSWQWPHKGLTKREMRRRGRSTITCTSKPEKPMTRIQTPIDHFTFSMRIILCEQVSFSLGQTKWSSGFLL